MTGSFFRENGYAIFGAKPVFEKLLSQVDFPPWEDYVRIFSGIFERQYYTNQGPLVDELEAVLAEFFKYRHVVCIANDALAMIMLTEALVPSGVVAIPALASPKLVNALLWSGKKNHFCDVEAESLMIDPREAAKALRQGAKAILGVNYCGNLSNMEVLASLSNEYSVPLYFESTHAMSHLARNPTETKYGIAEVFSLGNMSLISAGEGGCIGTNDDELAEKLRNIRSSYGSRKAISVHRTSNGRMSEAQAALALISLETLTQRLERNDLQRIEYQKALAPLHGINVLSSIGSLSDGCSALSCEIDIFKFQMPKDGDTSVESKNLDMVSFTKLMLLEILRAEGIPAESIFSVDPPLWLINQADLAVSRKKYESIFTLPVGLGISISDIRKISDFFRDLQLDACHLARELTLRSKP